MDTAELIVSNLVKRYDSPAGSTTVLDGVALEAHAGDTVAIVGPSGSGKSTFLNIVGALDQPTAGSVRYKGQDVAALSGPALASYRATQVGFVFQDHHLLPQLTAQENVVLPALAVKQTRQAEPRAADLLQRFGVAHRAAAFPARMSGGERQRVALARALINGAKLLLCDEPTGNLDRESAAGVVELLLELAAKQQVIVLMVSHNLELARRFGRVLELRGGKLVNRE